jgi:hypothetical protein
MDSPTEAGEGILLVLQAFIDDSRGDNGLFVLAGHIATAESWAQFANEWEEILPYSKLVDSNGVRYFKMAELARMSDGIERSQAFFRVIEKHILLSVSCRLNVNDLAKARERIVIPNFDLEWGWLDNSYLVAFRCLLDMFHTHKSGALERLIPLESSVDFIFDDQAEKGPVLAAWDSYMSMRDPDIRSRYGAIPRFEDDKKFLPLQAADFWAWWVRTWYDRNEEFLSFGSWSKKRSPYEVLEIEFGEDQIFTGTISVIRTLISPFPIIIDRKTGTPV